MSTKHTPGPWRLAFPLGIPEVVTEGPAIHCTSICSGFGDEIIENATATANARLMAAAPELLEALELFQEAWQGGDGHALTMELMEKASNNACIAIDKAKGKAA